MQTSTEFLDQIETFLEKHSIAPSTFGKLLMGDPTFVFHLREGRKPNIDTCARISRILEHPQACSIFNRRPSGRKSKGGI
jgi:hypothetical protein